METLTAERLPTDLADSERLREMRFRRRLLAGQVREEALSAAQARFGLSRFGAHNDAAIAWWLNVYPSIYAQMCGLYTAPPVVRGPSAEMAAAVSAAVRRSGHWTRMVRGQRDVLALRELLIMLDVRGGALVTQPVYPDLFTPPEPYDGDPSKVGSIGVWLQTGDAATPYERRDFTINGTPRYTAARVDKNGKLAEPYDVREGDAYPWRDGAGPMIPAVLYHAAETGWLLDWETGTDVAWGAVQLMVDYTSAEHAHSEASWLQRYVINAEIAGAEVRNVPTGAGELPRDVVVADPTSLLRLRSSEDISGQPLAGAFPQPTDPEALLRYCEVLSRALYAAAGIRGPEVQRNAADIRSAASLTVSREAQAELQQVFRPVFAAADRELLHKAAVLLGHASPDPDAWTVRYRPLRATAQEMSARIKAATEGRAAGLMTRLDQMLCLYPDLTEEEAIEALAEIDAEAKAAPAEPVTEDKNA